MTTLQSYYFRGKNSSPQWIPTPCFKATLHELLKSTFKEKHDRKTKTSKMCTERKILSCWYLKIPKNAKSFNKIINKCDWTNLTRKKYEYIYAIDKLPSVDFFPKFASFLSLSQTESASLPSLIN